MPERPQHHERSTRPDSTPDWRSILSSCEPGIRDLVAALWRLGIETGASCEGHIPPAFARGPFPYVVFDAREKNLQRLRKLFAVLREFNAKSAVR